MITEDYVSFETAKLLKEKGFDEKCFQYWHEEDNELVHSQSMHPIQNVSNPCFFGPAAPTLQMTMKWLRKKYEYVVLFDISAWGSYDWYYIYRGNRYHYEEMTFNYNELEDAAEAAVKYCLENLI